MPILTTFSRRPASVKPIMCGRDGQRMPEAYGEFSSNRVRVDPSFCPSLALKFCVMMPPRVVMNPGVSPRQHHSVGRDIRAFSFERTA